MAKHNYFFGKIIFSYGVGRDSVTLLAGVVGVREQMQCVSFVIQEAA